MSYVFDIFDGDAEVFLHPDPVMQADKSGTRVYLLHEGACVTIDLVPAKHKGSMVGRGWSAVLMSEAGFIESHHYDKLSPAFWDEAPWVICEGTPQQDETHFLTQLAVSGLPDDHPEAERKIAARNPVVHTSRANTIDHAFIPEARLRAEQEARYRGKRWADLWIYASWRAPQDLVFDAWQEDASVVSVGYPLSIGINNHFSYLRYLPAPTHRELYIDWHDGGAPGAALVIYIWNTGNPLDPNDPRPLMLVMEEYMDDEERLEYTSDGWWRVLRDMRDRRGVTKIYADPTSEHLIRLARRNNIPAKGIDNTDKLGRLTLINSQCHVPDGCHPALLVSADCKKLISRMATYHWIRGHDGVVTNRATQYNDHLIDCLAYAAGRFVRQTIMVPRYRT